jgi:hypothetical protein
MSTPTAGDWIRGAGPTLLAPTGRDTLLTAGPWSPGPSGVALRQDGQWTDGVLANHIWSVGGSGHADLNTSFGNPFVTYSAPDGWSTTAQAEASFDRERSDRSVPVVLSIGKRTRFGSEPVQFIGVVRCHAESLDNGPKGIAYRLSIVLLFPR